MRHAPASSATSSSLDAHNSPWALATAARGRGLLAAAEGEVEHGPRRSRSRARRTRPHALSLRAGTDPACRRARPPPRPTETLRPRNARTGPPEFDQLGARLWADRAREELARISGRRPATGELTATETELAALAAEGLANKEIAAALHMSVHTVEGHLTRIYRKLDIRSRAALAGRLSSAKRAGAR